MKHPRTPPQAGRKTLANSLVALSSAAVIAVYAAGYARTAPAAGQFAVTETMSNSVTTSATSPTSTTVAIAANSATATATNPVQPNGQATQGSSRQQPSSAEPGGTATATTATATPTAAASPTAGRSTPTATAPAVTTGAFRDGTYTGTGTSRHGSIGVTVTVQAGKIVAAEISDCGTRYPCSRIAALPGQVLTRQSAAVDVVSGATDSTNAYRAAVNAALAQAR